MQLLSLGKKKDHMFLSAQIGLGSILGSHAHLMQKQDKATGDIV